MKKLLLASALLIAGLYSAQDAGLKGKWYATAQVGFSQQKEGEVKGSSFNVLPIVGTFVSPDVTVGLAFGYIKNTIKAGDTTTQDLGVFAIEPLVRKYWNISGPFYFFGQLGAPILFGKESESENKLSQFGLAASAGFDVVVWKNVSFEFSYNIINFSSTTLDPDAPGAEKTTTTNFQIAHVADAGLDYTGLLSPISVGVKFLF
ncbi:MAG: porin family protein [Flavobacteriaceae bacterium]|nr:porin family protein [Flavobacteriaceae bacterium]